MRWSENLEQRSSLTPTQISQPLCNRPKGEGKASGRGHAFAGKVSQLQTGVTRARLNQGAGEAERRG